MSWSLVRLRFVPRDPSLVMPLAAKLLEEVAQIAGSVELLDWFVDDELGDLYVIARGEGVEKFAEEFSARLRGEGVWVEPMPTGTLGSWLAPVKPRPPDVALRILTPGGGVRLRLVHPDGSIEPLSRGEVLACMLTAGVDLETAESALSEALGKLGGRRVVSLGELADRLVDSLAKRHKVPARVLAAVRASLCPHAYVAVARGGKIEPVTRGLVEREVAGLLESTGLRPPPGLLERATRRAYERVRSKAVAAAVRGVLYGGHLTVLREGELRELVLRELESEAPLLRQMLSAEDVAELARRSAERAGELLSIAAREVAASSRLALVLEAISEALCSLCLLEGYLPTADPSELAATLGLEEVAETLRDVFRLGHAARAGDLYAKLLSLAEKLVEDARRELARR